MALMEWNDSLDVKNAIINDQHQQLLALINGLHDAVIDGNGAEALGKTLKGLMDYTEYHFAAEESLMKTHDYPDAVAHMEQHEKLINQVRGLLRKYDSGAPIMMINVLMFLRDWLMDHIHIIDKKFGDFLNTKGVI
ncbi:MAG TPA: hemerythrin family protein [Desulfuromonadales bacterium]|nr:hemerythrin family protein [Desulfuromonadales bacterium]